MLSKPTTTNNLLTTLTSSLDINRDALKLALDGYEKLKEQGKLNNVHYLTIIDFSKPSTSNRFYVIDMEQGQLLLQTLVAHGKKSGTVFANTFSNKDASSKSSLGFYVTGKTYIGKHGTTLELEGQEKGINDNAKERAIVIHGANYVSESIAKQQGYIGRSLGCPAVPNDQVNTIIEAIQGASCLFVYAPVKSYMRQSTLAN
ncbi:MAG: hypothetical protein RLZ95_344 [Bacteroidota bacterium]